MIPTRDGDYDFFASIRMRDLLIGWSILFVPMVVMLTLFVIFQEPEQIDPRHVFGCYASARAPRLEIGPKAIRVDQPDGLSLSYSIEAPKQGYRLHVKPIVALISVRGRYMFIRSENGFYWPLLATAYDDPNRLRQLKDFSGRFNVYARDGTQMIYSRIASAAPCF